MSAAAEFPSKNSICKQRKIWSTTWPELKLNRETLPLTEAYRIHEKITWEIIEQWRTISCLYEQFEIKSCLAFILLHEQFYVKVTTILIWKALGAWKSINQGDFYILAHDHSINSK